MKLLALFLTFAIVSINAFTVPSNAVPLHTTGINFAPSSSPRLAPDWSPVPSFAKMSWWATGTNLDGFLKPGLLQNVYINNNPSVIAIDAVNHIYFFNVSNSFYYANSEIACIGAPNYPTYTSYYPNTNHHWTSADQVAGYTTVAQVGKTFGPDEGYTTESFQTMVIPALGSTVILIIPEHLLYNPLQTVIVVPTDNEANFFQGQVVSYIKRTLTLTVTLSFGSGTFSRWNVYVSGDQIYTGPSFDLSTCLNPSFNSITTDNHGYIKAWLTWESYNVLALNYTQNGAEAVDISVSATYFDKIYPGTPPSELLVPPPGCVSPGINFCTANNMLYPFPAYFPFPGNAYYETYQN
jgi:hypothetical protein